MWGVANEAKKMRLINLFIFFARRSCTHCEHFKPILLRFTHEFGKCDLYKNEDGKIGYAECARLDQTKCGQGASWFEPKHKPPAEAIFVME